MKQKRNKQEKQTKRGEFVLKLAKKLEIQLKPYSKKIMLVGSIRRKEKNPRDIDIVLIPKDKEKLAEFMRKKGKFVEGGDYKTVWKIKGIKVELYYTIPEEWGAQLLAYSSKKGSEIGLRVIAKKKGFTLNNHGLFIGKKRIAGKTEREIYHALGRSWRRPENR